MVSVSLRTGGRNVSADRTSPSMVASPSPSVLSMRFVV